MKLDLYLIPHIKSNSKWIKDLNRGKTIKLLEENIGENIYDIGFGNYFLGMILEAQATEEKINCNIKI